MSVRTNGHRDSMAVDRKRLKPAGPPRRRRGKSPRISAACECSGPERSQSSARNLSPRARDDARHADEQRIYDHEEEFLLVDTRLSQSSGGARWSLPQDGYLRSLCSLPRRGSLSVSLCNPSCAHHRGSAGLPPPPSLPSCIDPRYPLPPRLPDHPHATSATCLLAVTTSGKSSGL